MTVIQNDALRVEIAGLGAELQSIRTRADGAEWLWQGDARWWAGRSPLLFPVIGRSPDDAVTIGGRSFPMGSHGFARHSHFRLEQIGGDMAELLLEADEATHAAYPFDFQLRIGYRVQDRTLICRAAVSNLDSAPMPFQFGFHPAFVWPLPGMAGQPHGVELENGGAPVMMRPNADGLIAPTPYPTPFDKGALVLDQALFQDGAMVFPEGAGDAVRFGSATTHVRMRSRNLPQFALWQKPGAGYLCLEPWRGMAPFPDQGPAIEQRNHHAILPPGETAEFLMELQFSRDT
ncbi:aldose 1-epimerase family protein [Paracoccus shanxieyensis]|uniref:Aldose 1-epimerase family protein n=1 Tax=Paracoccus shanxieyensis TaxID=2675752 RepID=A0A6L6J665_9RHOB|nr:aldose 1-epimerase family protein [Paracoccus shanxieyensis]MTH66184.1 aldose 1-epimerase family protein [Paracoccus shanxieyensis]MTH89467.1 aldose 1-epimerase family protein [Paracoccus shanxieyensis]